MQFNKYRVKLNTSPEPSEIIVTALNVDHAIHLAKKHFGIITPVSSETQRV